jgi:hypothetical protein
MSGQQGTTAGHVYIMFLHDHMPLSSLECGSVWVQHFNHDCAKGRLNRVLNRFDADYLSFLRLAPQPVVRWDWYWGCSKC